MKLKAVVDESQFGELDEGQRALYAQAEDGRYFLDVEGVDDLPQVRSLRNGHMHSKRERDEAKRQLESLRRKFGPLSDIEDLDLSDVDLERFEQVLPYLRGESSLPGGEGSAGDGKGQQLDIEKLKANARKPLERDLATLTAERDQLKARLEGLVTDSALTAALSEIKINGPYTRAVKAMFRDRVRVVEGDDGAVAAVIEGEYGEQPVDKYLKEWAQTDEGKAFIEPARGADAPGSRHGAGRIKNPWAKDNWNPTEQARIYREQGPEVARRMAAEHGKKVL